MDQLEAQDNIEAKLTSDYLSLLSASWSHMAFCIVRSSLCLYGTEGPGPPPLLRILSKSNLLFAVCFAIANQRCFSVQRLCL